MVVSLWPRFGPPCIDPLDNQAAKGVEPVQRHVTSCRLASGISANYVA